MVRKRWPAILTGEDDLKAMQEASIVKENSTPAMRHEEDTTRGRHGDRRANMALRVRQTVMC